LVFPFPLLGGGLDFQIFYYISYYLNLCNCLTNSIWRWFNLNFTNFVDLLSRSYCRLLLHRYLTHLCYSSSRLLCLLTSKHLLRNMFNFTRINLITRWRRLCLNNWWRIIWFRLLLQNSRLLLRMDYLCCDIRWLWNSWLICRILWILLNQVSCWWYIRIRSRYLLILWWLWISLNLTLLTNWHLCSLL